MKMIFKYLVLMLALGLVACDQQSAHFNHPDPLGWKHHMAVLHKDSIQAVYDIYYDSVILVLDYRQSLFNASYRCGDMDCLAKFRKRIDATNITKQRVSQIHDSLSRTLSAAHDSVLATHRYTNN